MTFYYAPNTISTAVAYALEDIGLGYTPAPIDFKATEQSSAEYLAINPKGRVPALVTDHGILTETGAILEYLASLVPDRALVPDDAWQAAQMRSAMFYLAGTAHVNHAHKRRGSRWATRQDSFEDMTAKVPETMAATCRFIEDNWALSPFVLGERMSMADPYLYSVCTWLEGDSVDINAFPKLSAFFAMMNDRPAGAAIRDKGFLS
ncbi:MAG: glutathione S-transferase family protein [Pseudomonadota bacterium]|uniref:glutathione S-transferase family protein n=1 Tax=Roseovarius TaxID=74030 RepID=UPI0022A74034|nr:glutathione S-transferase family protein [Roseovarius sp. EGI FJ00037]MCZ0811522.1 glutathione S-transferase family protein [Roseovarius sp. EGI FJ00037]